MIFIFPTVALVLISCADWLWFNQCYWPKDRLSASSGRRPAGWHQCNGRLSLTPDLLVRCRSVEVAPQAKRGAFCPLMRRAPRRK
jgi:hypothetical protein